MKIKHNKKRNVGLLFEQISSVLTTAVLSNNRKNAEICTRILGESFAPGTELVKELRLFRALSTVTVKNDALLDRIIREAREAAGNVDVKKLSREKSALIRRLNESFGKDTIFSQPVENFRSLATVQVLINEWRKDSSAPYVFELEDKLMTEMKHQPVAEKREEVGDVNQIIVEMAKKRFFDKHKNLSSTQLAMLFEHVSATERSRPSMTERYEDLRKMAVTGINTYLAQEGNKQSEYFVQKLKEAKGKIEGFSFDDCLPPEKQIARALTIQKLLEELNNE